MALKAAQLLRVAPFLLSLSWIIYLAGVTWIGMFPRFSRNTWISENAILPGYARANFGAADVTFAGQLASELNAKRPTWDNDFPQWLFDAMQSLKLDAYVHNFTTPMHTRGQNVFGILRSGRADGREAVVLATRIRPGDEKGGWGETSGLCLSLALMRFLSGEKWLSKDIILLVLDGRHKYSAAAKAWLDTYHLDTGNEGMFPRAGVIRQAIVLDFDRYRFNALGLVTEGISGQLSNLDLVNTLRFVAAGQNVNVVLGREPSPAMFNALFKFMKHAALGRTEEDHSHFLRWAIDSYTLTGTNTTSTGYIHTQAIAKVFEGIVRSMSTVSQHLFMSFFLYVLCSPSQFVSIGVYLYPIMMILAPLILQSLYLHFSNNNPMVGSAVSSIAATVSFGAIILHVIPLMDELSTFLLPNSLFRPELAAGLWIIFVVIAVIGLFNIIFPRIENMFRDKTVVAPVSTSWISLKAYLNIYFIFATVFLAICNFSAATFSVIPLVPIAFFPYPIKFVQSRMQKMQSLFVLILLPLTSPLSLCVWLTLSGSGHLLHDVYQRMEEFRFAGTLVMPLVCLVYFPLQILAWRVCLFGYIQSNQVSAQTLSHERSHTGKQKDQ
eukprot:GILJ01009941.1.p1 GENE.GILJ01009941.1~~GILJ01009941.1.p1  ORF type:complete len:625 (-),score=59.41 GILJ01009941.1:58-1884(-)